ncbi:MAG TPA: hypothetical protein VM537_17005 [Anaerolineae bacterium]|nr:hypothetical protein [Anaerolineae bacterium]
MKRKGLDTNVNAFPLLDEPEAGRPERSRALGAVEHIYDTCGMMGLCPECRRKGIVELHMGCQQHYVAGRVRGEPDP